MAFQKGYTPWNKGKEASEETRKKMSKTRKGVKFSESHRLAMLATYQDGRVPFWLGKKFSEEQKKKMSKSSKGHFVSKETGKKISESKKGHLVSEKTRGKIAISLKGKAAGENNPSWLGGKSFEPYTPEWTKTLRLAIRQRDNFTCRRCGITEEEHLEKTGRVLSVNHIDFDKTNCDSKNLNTLCCGCNGAVNFNREYWTNYFKQKLCV